MEGGITKNDKLDTITICDVLDTPERKKQYRITKVDRFDLYEQRQLTRHHHNLKEELNIYCNRLQKSIDLVFPEFNTLFGSKYGIVYMNLLKTFGSAEAIASTDIRTIRKCFEVKGKGGRISLTPEKLKECAKYSIGISSEVETIQIKHLVSQITLIKEQIAEIDKKNRRVLNLKQLSYPKHSRDFSFLWYFYFSRIRRYWQLFQAFSNH